LEHAVKPLGLGIVGLGKIGREQHIPAVRADAAFELIACASAHAEFRDVRNFADLEAMLDNCPEIDAVAICTPPQAHYAAAKSALQRGKHVLLEKPPCHATMQLDELAALARRVKRTLFQTWHARYAPMVGTAERWLKDRTLLGGQVEWKEDVRQWHPGQNWLWKQGGFGVFDPGINAISILTKIVNEPILAEAADLFFPENCSSPIAADVTFTTTSGASIGAAFDFRHAGAPCWTIELETDGGALILSEHGNALAIDGCEIAAEATEAEYPSLYRRFAELIERNMSDVDDRPFRLVADIFLIGSRSLIEPFRE
jgi:D-galactose 1-dehydrogenase